MGENKAYKTPTDIYSNNKTIHYRFRMFLKEHRNTFWGGFLKKYKYLICLSFLFCHILEYIKIENCFFLIVIIFHYRLYCNFDQINTALVSIRDFPICLMVVYF